MLWQYSTVFEHILIYMYVTPTFAGELLVKTLHVFFLIFIYLFLQREEGREEERETNINMWLTLMHPLLGT